ncbi:MAG TPA: cytochrome c oxidase subunit II [Propionibacteriaceae bacterium]|nr:cytochrome c oxidase subunit II [Propionibacteriaceae bacterium]
MRGTEFRPVEQNAPRTASRVRSRRLLVVMLAVGALSLSGCTAGQLGELKRLGLPPSASDRAPYIHDLWIGTWIAALLVGFGVWGLIGWASLRYRNRGGLLPKQNRYNLPLEIFYTMAPFIIVGVLFYHTIVAQDRVVARVPEPDHTIDVVGQKWAWTFNYREANNPAVGQDVWETGTIDTYADLYLPVGKTVRFNESSPDVNHSFWIPAFYYKLDVIPGRLNSFDVTPNKVGTFDGRCAELCGTYHSRMLFTVHVVTEAEYNAHLKGLAAVGQTGVAKGPAIPDSQGEAKEQDIPEVGNR